MNVELDPKEVEYFNVHGTAELEKFWSRFGGRPNMDASFLDVGCGHGGLCIDLAKHGARKVIGVDIDKERIDFAKKNLLVNFPELVDQVEFYEIDLQDFENSEQFDYIIQKTRLSIL